MRDTSIVGLFRAKGLRLCFHIQTKATKLLDEKWRAVNRSWSPPEAKDLHASKVASKAAK